MSDVFSCTPTVSVLDNRGLIVRENIYYRHPQLLNFTDERITRHRFNKAGFSVMSISPRQYDLQQLESEIPADRLSMHSLNDVILRNENVDDGISLQLTDVMERSIFAVNAEGVKRHWLYENNALSGRLLAITEQAPNSQIEITERFVWGESTAAEKAYNLAGYCVRHYDTAGCQWITSVALSGVMLAEHRSFLADETEANWQGKSNIDWESQLSDKVFSTIYTADATGRVVTKTDAQGNQQRIAYDLAGQRCKQWLMQKGLEEKVIINSLAYTAAGQIQREEAGNGVVTTYTYESETQRLIGIKTERPKGHASGAALLQDLRYGFDPVGNVISVRNDADITRFWRNQKIEPESHYIYDSLYQLVSTSGREMANVGQQTNQIPKPALLDNHTYTNYLRNYSYDRNGNLIAIQHSASATGNNYTTRLTVSRQSNRAVLSTLTEDPNAVEAQFDKGGHQLQLLAGSPLSWNKRGELRNVTMVTHDIGLDSECYFYDSNSQRVMKINRHQTGNIERKTRFTYLSGLEKREVYSGEDIKSAQDIVTVGNAQIAHWYTGLPPGAENNYISYNHSNLTGSCVLQTDNTGLVINQEEYYPYGGTAIWLVSSETNINYKTRRYSGQICDATGLYYYGYRYYQPWAGRWISADPAGDIDGLNLFCMVGNNPTSNVDPDGRMLKACFGGCISSSERSESYGPRPVSDFERLIVKDDIHNKLSLLFENIGIQTENIALPKDMQGIEAPKLKWARGWQNMLEGQNEAIPEYVYRTHETSAISEEGLIRNTDRSFLRASFNQENNYNKDILYHTGGVGTKGRVLSLSSSLDVAADFHESRARRGVKNSIVRIKTTGEESNFVTVVDFLKGKAVEAINQASNDEEKSELENRFVRAIRNLGGNEKEIFYLPGNVPGHLIDVNVSEKKGEFIWMPLSSYLTQSSSKRLNKAASSIN